MDRVFKYPKISLDFLSLLRSWHERAKIGIDWKKLRLVMVNSEEVYIPLDINQSPFNVGMPVRLSEFTTEQVLELATRHGLNLSDEQVRTLMKMCGGHPYLIRVALYIIAQGEMTLREFLQVAPTEEGMYTEHLRRHLLNLEDNSQLLIAMRRLVLEEKVIQVGSREAFKLASMGLVKFQGNEVLPLCELYSIYFRERLA